MNTVSVVFALCAVAAFALEPSEFLPCSFQVGAKTHILSGGVEVANSEDIVYHDHDNLWRWDGQFSGLPGLFDAHEWSIIWRPDNGISYHLQTDTGVCKENNGGSKMYPYPYDWIASKTDGVVWTQQDVTYENSAATMYVARAKSTRYKFTLEASLFVLKSGELVYGNGTLQSSLIDVEFTMDINQYIFRKHIPAQYFMTARPCPVTTRPAEPSKEFTNYCYVANPSSAGFAVKPNFLAVVAALLAAFLIYMAL